MQIYKLREQYRSLVTEFTNQARAAGGIVHASPLVVKAADDGNVEVSCLFHLKEWPYSSTSNKPTKKIDILIRSLEEYEVNSLCLIKSTVQLMYFRSNAELATPTLGLHYDYEFNIGAAHPIFHAQFGSSAFSQEELSVVKFDRVVQQWPDMVRVRIPTVHIGFPATMLSVFADHLSHESFSGFLNWAREQLLFTSAKTKIDCRYAPMNAADSSIFQAHRLYV